MKKTLCSIAIVILTLSLFPLIRLSTVNAQWATTFSIVNPGPDGYPAKWNASTTDRGFGTSDFIFYSNETAVNSRFFINITINNAEAVKGWAVGLIFDKLKLSYVSAWRPSDHVFKPVEEMGWTIVAPSVTFEDLNETHKRLMWGCTYIMGEPEWTFNGSGTLCQIQFQIIKEVNLSTPQAVAWFTFDPDWTAVYHHPAGTEIPTLGTGYFEYNYVPYIYTLTITTTTGGTTTPPPGTYTYTEGTVVPVTAIADSGSTFDHWELDGSDAGSDNPINVTMDNNHTLHAIFRAPPVLKIEPPTYTALRVGEIVKINITINNLDEEWHLIAVQFAVVYDTAIFDFVQWQSGTYLDTFLNNEETIQYFSQHDFHGEPGLPYCHNKVLVGAIIFPGTDNKYYEPFPSGNGVIGTISFRVKAEAPVSTLLTLNETELWSDSFTQIPHSAEHASFNFPFETRNLTITTTTGGTTDPEPGTHIYEINTDVLVTAIADSGFTFDHWELDGSDAGSDNPISVTMDDDHILHAIFIDNTAPVVEITYPTEGAYISGATIWINGTITEENKGTLEPSINDTRFSLTYWDSVSGAFAFSNDTAIGDGLVAVTVSFMDLAENTGSDTVSFIIDNTPPVINAPAQNPTENNVQPNQQVKITVNVTDLTSGVKNVTLFYTNDTSWYSVEMVYNSTSGLWEATIPGHAQGIQVKYTIKAYDNAENYAVNDNAGDYFTYTVIPEYSSIILILLFMIMTTTIMMVSTRRKFRKKLN
ncbi:MAG: cohesin domain-containing protein [Candidatus Bathyarchaeia archaeon]